MTTRSSHASPILVTGAAGAVGSIGRSITEMLLAKGRMCAGRMNAPRPYASLALGEESGLSRFIVDCHGWRARVLLLSVSGIHILAGISI
jgi:hypothetical protein